MVYLSLTLIIIGTFLILFTIISRFSEKYDIQKKEPAAPQQKGVISSVSFDSLQPETSPGENAAESRHEIFSGEKTSSGSSMQQGAIAGEHAASNVRRQDATDGQTHVATADNLEKVQSDDSHGKHADGKKSHDGKNDNDAILYEDFSLNIDYNGGGVIEPGVDEYKKLHRIGKGRIDVSKEGFNFYVDKKFYRFDFHLIDSMKKGRNYLAISIKGGNVIRLFLFEKESEYINELYKAFNTRMIGR